jgi:DNA-binding IclR family transcriptional regulator
VRAPRRADDIRSLRYGFEALRKASSPSGISSGELALSCGISRAAAFRVLQTLRSAGYLIHTGSLRRARYRVSQQVRELISGYPGVAQLLDAAMPVMLEWTQASGWPLALSTLAGDRLVVRYATDHAAPRALARYKAGTSGPVLGSASGLVCLGFQAPAVVAAFLAGLPDDSIMDGERICTREHCFARLARVRSDGFAVVHPPRLRESALAVPLLIDGVVAASLALRFMRVADGGPEAHAQRLQTLHSLRARIAAVCNGEPGR